MNFELRPAGTTPSQPDSRQLVWAAPGQTSDVQASVDAWLTELGDTKAGSIDFVRLAAAAYLADRLESRGAGYSRSIGVHVQLADPERWSPLTAQVADLLGWISNDQWTITVSGDGLTRPAVIPGGDDAYERVALLSGGLDSFCGAVLNESRTLFISHSDNPTVTASQTRTWDWLRLLHKVNGSRLQLGLSETAGKVESSTRTRSLLFYALAVVAAEAQSIDVVEVPENGFTSVNVPLGADRGGVLTTRSTHPWTFEKLRSILKAAGIPVTMANPYSWVTKGELVEAASEAANANFAEGSALTLSCAKMDGRTFKGGNPNRNCGVCVACLTRRGGFLSSGVEDKTTYLLDSLAASRADLLKKRRSDIRAVEAAVARAPEFDEFDLVACGPFPDGFAIADATDLVHRGMVELGLAVGTL